MLNLTTDAAAPRVSEKFCSFGITEALVPLLVTGLTSAGVGAGTAATIAGVAAPALVGAGTGALTSAVTGGKPLKGAMFGALGGGALGGLGQAFPETMGSLGLGGSSASLDANGNWAPGAQGFPTSGAAYLDSSGNYVPGAQGFANGNGAAVDPGMSDAEASANYGGWGLPGALNASASPMGASTGAASNGLSGTIRALNGLGALGQIAGAFAGPGKPNYGVLPGPSSTAATQGPLFNKSLPTSGYFNRTQTPNYSPINGDWYHYGQNGGQMPFFQNNQISLPGMARGGALCMSCGGKMAGGGGAGALGHVAGAGDGTSDSIPAKLSDGEYVLTAADVSRIGNGSTKAGAVKLDRMRSQIARDAGARKIQGKVKEPMGYLRKAS